MQGDWMSSLSRLNRCADPRGLIKKRRGGASDIIRPSDLLLHRSRKALRRLIRRLPGGQWDIDFPAPLLQLSQFTCLIDWWSFSYYTHSVVLRCRGCPPQRRRNPFRFTVSVFAYFSHIFTRVFECFLLTGNDRKLSDWFMIFLGYMGNTSDLLHSFFSYSGTKSRSHQHRKVSQRNLFISTREFTDETKSICLVLSVNQV